MAKLKAARRKRLPASAFAYPRQRKYPIDTLARARNALARAAQSSTFGSYSHVARKVRARYGDAVATVGRTKGTVSGPGPRRRRRSSSSSPAKRRGRK